MLQLFGHPFSSYTWKAQIALHANHVEHRFRMLDPGHPDNLDFIARAHPAGKFPVLVDGDAIVVEATSIVEHVALHHPGDAPLIPADPALAVTTRMLDRVFDNYVMANMQRVIAAHFLDSDNPRMGLRDQADSAEFAAGKAGLKRAYRWLEDWLGENEFGPHVSLASCAAAPALFYADWVLEIPPDCARLKDLRAQLLALEAVGKCVDAARPYRQYFPPGAPDRD